MNRNNPNLFHLILFFVPAFCFMGGRLYHDIVFDRGIGGHLKRAADANSIELAQDELQLAVSEMEERHMTDGYTSLVYNTPDEDVGFWFKNTKTALDSIKALPKTASETDKETKLLKLRQTLVDHTQSGESVTCPDGISVYPNNMNWAIFATLSSLLACAVFLMF